MADIKEHCICIEFHFKLGTMAAATYNMLQTAFEEETISRIQRCD
jgi:hypothetical protein